MININKPLMGCDAQPSFERTVYGELSGGRCPGGFRGIFQEGLIYHGGNVQGIFCRINVRECPDKVCLGKFFGGKNFTRKMSQVVRVSVRFAMQECRSLHVQRL